MFDVFNIQLPNLQQHPAFEVGGHESTFGPSDELFVFVQGAKFAQILPASPAHSDLAVSIGSTSRAHCTVLLIVTPAANAAARNDESWASFLAALCSVLRAHSAWRVICESDCDQHPRQPLRLSPVALADHLDSVRRDRALPIAFEANNAP